MDIGDLCDICCETSSEDDCLICSLRNPCYGCEYYDLENDICKCPDGEGCKTHI